MNTRQFLLVLVPLLFAPLGMAGENDETKFTLEATTGVQQREQTIKTEIELLDGHSWAGEYYRGDGLGANVSLALAPEAGYVFEWHGCLGLYDRNYGNVTEQKNRIRLSFTFENELEGFQGIAEELIPVAWGNRRYLIPVDDVIGFCNNVNGGVEPRDRLHGFYLLRVGDEKVAVSGFPILPKEYRSCLLENSITVEIISINSVTTRPSLLEWKFKDTYVTLNKGNDHGLLAGMELHVLEPENVVETIQVTEVEDNQAQGIMTEFGEEEPGPSVGWKLSTKPQWRE